MYDQVHRRLIVFSSLCLCWCWGNQNRHGYVGGEGLFGMGWAESMDWAIEHRAYCGAEKAQHLLCPDVRSPCNVQFLIELRMWSSLCTFVCLYYQILDKLGIKDPHKDLDKSNALMTCSHSILSAYVVTACIFCVLLPTLHLTIFHL